MEHGGGLGESKRKLAGTLFRKATEPDRQWTAAALQDKGKWYPANPCRR